MDKKEQANRLEKRLIKLLRYLEREVAPREAMAKNIIDLIHDANYRHIPDDQTLPKNKYNSPFPGKNLKFDIYRQAQQDMWDAGWRKVE